MDPLSWQLRGEAPRWRQACSAVPECQQLRV